MRQEPPSAPSVPPPLALCRGPCLTLPFAQLLESTVYDIVPAQDLPQFDPSLTLKRLIVPRRWLPQYNWVLKRYALAIRLAYIVGLTCRAISAAAPISIGEWTAIASIPLQLPALLNVILQFRVAFLKLMVRTYDFWYYFILSSVFGLSMAWYFRDWRIAIVPIMWIDVQNATLLDAFLQDFRAIVTATWISFSSLVGVVIAVSLDSVTTNSTVFETKHRTITVKEVLLNTTATVIILIARVLYRKRCSKLKEQRNATTTRMVDSITLTWPLRLREHERRDWRPQRQHFQPTKLQLQLTLHCNHLKASDVLLPAAPACVQDAVVSRWVIRGMGVSGLVATPIAFFVPVRLRLAFALWATVCSVIYCSIMLAFYHRRLFTQLVLSFDFAFVSLQLSTVLLCVADTFRWQAAPTLCMVSCWLWLHLIMTQDALTPVMRRAIGFRPWAQIPVLLLAQVAAAILWLEVSVWDSQHLYDRRFVDIQVGRHRVQLHVVPCLLSRLLTVCLWSARMLYRIATRTSDHDLLFIRSHVEFDALFHHRKRRRSPTTRIMPAPDTSELSIASSTDSPDKH